MLLAGGLAATEALPAQSVPGRVQVLQAAASSTGSSKVRRERKSGGSHSSRGRPIHWTEFDLCIFSSR
jgi:hypothetical protein